MTDYNPTQIIKAAKTLLYNNCRYYIQLPNGDIISNNPPITDNKPFSNYYRPFVDHLTPGQTGIVPIPAGVPMRALRSRLAAHLSTRWGTSSYATTRTPAGILVTRQR
jgi:hypothetical protein